MKIAFLLFAVFFSTTAKAELLDDSDLVAMPIEELARAPASESASTSAHACETKGQFRCKVLLYGTDVCIPKGPNLAQRCKQMARPKPEVQNYIHAHQDEWTAYKTTVQTKCTTSSKSENCKHVKKQITSLEAAPKGACIPYHLMYDMTVHTDNGHEVGQSVFNLSQAQALYCEQNPIDDAFIDSRMKTLDDAIQSVKRKPGSALSKSRSKFYTEQLQGLRKNLNNCLAEAQRRRKNATFTKPAAKVVVQLSKASPVIQEISFLDKSEVTKAVTASADGHNDYELAYTLQLNSVDMCSIQNNKPALEPSAPRPRSTETSTRSSQ